MTRRDDFPLLAAQPGLVYLDSAATAHKPRAVLDAIRTYYETANANPHRGAYALAARATQAYADARATVARFLGVGDPARLVFARGTTEAMNLVAQAWGRAHLAPGDRVIVTRMDHHATFVPWQQIARECGAEFVVCELTPDGELDLGVLTGLVTAGRTRVVAVPHVSNVLGTIVPVPAVAALAHRHGAVCVVDGAQGAPHLPVAFDALGADAYTFSGHKMGGPMGSGGVALGAAFAAALPPWQFGGDMIEHVGDSETTWNVAPHRWEAGTPNVEAAVGLAAACEYLADVGLAAVRAHEQALLARLLDRLHDTEGVHVLGPRDIAHRSGCVAFTVDDVHPHDVAQLLDADGICVRAGHHCCQPLHRALRIPASVRASVWVYSTEGEVDALAAAVAKARAVFA
jgi:cysteine desulfurase/selenocysteine lyase